jgi:hypothetical protein
MKVVINKCYGGFSLSEAVYNELGIPYDGYGYLENADLGIVAEGKFYAYRSDERLIAAIEKIGEKKSGGRSAELKVVEIPDDVEWYLEEYDGREWVSESHRTWS